MTGEWKTRSLGDLFEIENGFAFKSADFQDFGIPVIKIKNIKSNHFAEGDHSFVASRFTQKRPSKVARRGDLLISMSGNRHDGSPETWVGKVAPFNQTETFLINQRVGALRPKDRASVSARYFGYLLSSWSFQEHFIAVATSSGGQANLSPKQILAVPVRFPPLPEQRAIAGTLGALDDKIELNRKMNATLEAMARALFRDWFVDFGPTRARMEGRAPYLSPDLWALFPDRLDGEGKPEGWAVLTLGQIAGHHTKTLTPEKMAGVDVEHFSLPAFDRGQIPTIDLGATIKSNKTIVPPEAVLLSKLNPEISRVWMPETQGALQQVSSTEFLAFTAKAGAGRSLLFCLFSDQSFREMLNGMVTGTSKSHQRISPPALLGREVIRGKPEMFSAFEKSAAPLLERVRANRAESRTLAQTRDLLLPRLMSGELRVAEAERMVETAL